MVKRRDAFRWPHVVPLSCTDRDGQVRLLGPSSTDSLVEPPDSTHSEKKFAFTVEVRDVSPAPTTRSSEATSSLSAALCCGLRLPFRPSQSAAIRSGTPRAGSPGPRPTSAASPPRNSNGPGNSIQAGKVVKYPVGRKKKRGIPEARTAFTPAPAPSSPLPSGDWENAIKKYEELRNKREEVLRAFRNMSSDGEFDVGHSRWEKHGSSLRLKFGPPTYRSALGIGYSAG